MSLDLHREDLGSLALFLVVAEQRSFTRAAAQLCMSQSALSHAMRRLETRLGLRLLTRTTRSVAPTEAGERLIETLRPALDAIHGRLVSLADLRARPAGTIRITTPEQPARTLLWPAIERLTADYPDIHVELDVERRLTDIVADRYDAGVRLGERLEQDMIAVPIGPPLRMATVATPDYLTRHGTPQTPYELGDHACIGLRMTDGSLYAWEYDQDGRAFSIRVQGPFVANDVDLILLAAQAGRGIAHVLEDRVTASLADKRLVRLFDSWCAPFDGYHLYYPSRRQPSAAFALLLSALRYRG
ncbi:LysR family transcriptional regulator [Sphingomonas sp. RIT328]|uniref:LysR family transcriptional regulator n=1 Tax=Sphingomonas sp. RIT328 TaxID=1470591 RepID=UPI00044E8310|nr:LysR family transcriptional regulator [Sphingomonas sp. RIT328]EZP48648.1 Transcriptional regulator, LysR family [Sphingomonas sp. RIT328]